MPAVSIMPVDLAPFADIDPAKAQAMIDDALALAARVAPCITDPAFEFDDAAKAIIRGAILRWNDSGSGVVTQEAWGPYSQTVDSRQTRRSMFWPSEITDLQALCQEKQQATAFTVDTAPALGGGHMPWCSLNFGATYCSCGVDIAGAPIYENL